MVMALIMKEVLAFRGTRLKKLNPQAGMILMPWRVLANIQTQLSKSTAERGVTYN
jgi:hypothetical protein